jgi:hypothetical protein
MGANQNIRSRLFFQLYIAINAITIVIMTAIRFIYLIPPYCNIGTHVADDVRVVVCISGEVMTFGT